MPTLGAKLITPKRIGNMLDPKDLPQKIPPNYVLPKVSKLGTDDEALFHMVPDGKDPTISKRTSPARNLEEKELATGGGIGERGTPPRKDEGNMEIINMLGDIKSEMKN